MANDAMMTVQVCYVSPQRQFLKNLQVAVGCTIHQAIRASGLLEEFDELDISVAQVGIYAKLKTLDTVLRPDDRVEVYRPLLVDPMTARRARANKRARR